MRKILASLIAFWHKLTFTVPAHTCTFSNVPEFHDLGQFDNAFFYKCTYPGCNMHDVKTYLTNRGIKLYRKLHELHPEFYTEKFKKHYVNAELCNPEQKEYWLSEVTV